MHAPRPKPPPPRHLSQPEFQNNPPRRLRRHVQRLRHHPGRHQRFRHHQFNQFRQLRRGAAPVELPLKHGTGQRQPVMLLQPDLGGRQKPWAMASSRVSRSRLRRRSTGTVFRPRLIAARCAPDVMPAWRRIEAAGPLAEEFAAIDAVLARSEPSSSSSCPPPGFAGMHHADFLRDVAVATR